MNYLKSKHFVLLSSLLLALLMTGCFDDRENLFTEEQLEWEPPNPANNSLSMDVSLDADQTESEIVTLRMRYAGAQKSDSFNGVFEIDTDAVEGEHYAVSSYTLTVPANSSFSEEVEIEIFADEIENGESFELVLTITDESDVEPMENYRNLVIEVEKDE